MVRSITADIGDEIRLEGGSEQIGLLYALTNATTKVAGAFSIFLTFSVLAYVGYNPKEGAVNSASQIQGLELAYLIGPIFFVMLGGACFLGYGLGAERHAEIRRQLEERDALYDEAPRPRNGLRCGYCIRRILPERRLLNFHPAPGARQRQGPYFSRRSPGNFGGIHGDGPKALPADRRRIRIDRGPNRGHRPGHGRLPAPVLLRLYRAQPGRRGPGLRGRSAD
jgi:hypothetical protein